MYFGQLQRFVICTSFSWICFDMHDDGHSIISRYCHSFCFAEQKVKNIWVKCDLCPAQRFDPLRKNLNLSKYLDKQPACAQPVSKDLAPKQPGLDFNHSVLTPVTQGQLNKLIALHVVENTKPLCTLESPTFMQLVSNVPCAGGPQMDRKTFSNYLDS